MCQIWYTKPHDHQGPTLENQSYDHDHIHYIHDHDNWGQKLEPEPVSFLCPNEECKLSYLQAKFNLFHVPDAPIKSQPTTIGEKWKCFTCTENVSPKKIKRVSSAFIKLYPWCPQMIIIAKLLKDNSDFQSKITLGCKSDDYSYDSYCCKDKKYSSKRPLSITKEGTFCYHFLRDH